MIDSFFGPLDNQDLAAKPYTVEHRREPSRERIPPERAKRLAAISRDPLPPIDDYPGPDEFYAALAAWRKRNNL